MIWLNVAKTAKTAKHQLFHQHLCQTQTQTQLHHPFDHQTILLEQNLVFLATHTSQPSIACALTVRQLETSSLQTPEFMIQERFSSVGSNFCLQTSVSTGIVINDVSVPTVQLSTPRNSTANALNMIGNCPIDFYVDRIATNITDDHAWTCTGHLSLRIMRPCSSQSNRCTHWCKSLNVLLILWLSFFSSGIHSLQLLFRWDDTWSNGNTQFKSWRWLDSSWWHHSCNSVYSRR